jgi:superfamily II DNA/RNA helicase
LKRKKKKIEVKDENTQVSIKKLPVPSFQSLTVFEKCFWSGDESRGPHGDELKMQRKAIGVLVKGDNADACPAPVLTLQDPCLPEAFKQVFSSANLHSLTAVQMQCWPAILSGLNVLAVAPTGSGKTFAYGLAMAPHILSQLKGKDGVLGKSPYALVLVPTRELAIQVASALKVHSDHVIPPSHWTH